MNIKYGYLFIMLVLQVLKCPAQRPVMYVNDMPVDEREFQREMKRFRSDIISEVSVYRLVEKNDDFWHSAVLGSTPLQMLREKTKEAMIRIKIQEQLLSLNDLWETRPYDSLLLQLGRVNKSRQRAVAGGGIIYGPVAYTETDYFDYLFTNAIQQLKSLLNQGILKIADLSFGNCLARGAISTMKNERPGDSAPGKLPERTYAACLDSCVKSAVIIVDRSLYLQQGVN